MSKDKLEKIKSFHRLQKSHQNWLIKLADEYRFSHQQLQFLIEFSMDMTCWNEGSLERFFKPEAVGKSTGKEAASKVFSQLRSGYENLKNNIKEYPVKGSFKSKEKKFPESKVVETTLKGSIMGKCPVASEKTRCCNLNTLDAVQQCGFDCSYCSIQSFYHGNQVKFIENLAEHLESLEIDDDKPIHIGTGQSSDSLMWGNRFGLLDNLSNFAKKHQNVILEMKSKSSRIEYFLEYPPPPNIIFTWSLNTEKVISAEEKGTAPLEKRMESARKIADMGSPVGFHFHPMIWYEGWQDEYLSIVSRLQEKFSPDEVVMISMGTLTFIKPVIKKIRERMSETSILRFPMEECAGKLSYPIEIKKDLFSTLYSGFPREWQRSVFFYMCMEDKNLWQPIFGRSYSSNEEFEDDMLNSYMNKISEIKRRNINT